MCFSLICLVFLGDLLGCFILGMNAIYLLAKKTKPNQTKQPNRMHGICFCPSVLSGGYDVHHVDMNAGAVA